MNGLPHATRADALIQAYMEDALSEEQERELRSWLAEDPENIREFVSQIQLDLALWDQHAAGADAQQEPAARHSWTRTRPSFRAWLVPLAVAASVAIAVGAWWFARGRQPAGLGLRVVEAGGQVVWGRSPEPGTQTPACSIASPTPLRIGDSLGPGDGVEVGAEGFVKLAYADGSMLELDKETILAVGAGRGKTLALSKGALTASVAKQPPGQPLTVATPQAKCTVLGTRFFLIAGCGQTTNGLPAPFSRLDVIQGSVGFADAAASATDIVVAAGQAILAGTGATGQAITTRVIPSDGRPFSPKYGGVYFKDYIEDFEKNGFVLGRRKTTDGRTLLDLTCEDLLKTSALLVENPSGNEPDNRSAAAIARALADMGARATLTHDKPSGRQVLELVNPSGDFSMLSLKQPIDWSRPQVFESECQWLPLRADAQLVWTMRAKPRDPTPPTEKTYRKTPAVPPDADWRVMRIETLPVGRNANGDAVVETRMMFGDMTVQHWWARIPSQGSTHDLRIAIKAGTCRIGRTVVKELEME